MSDHRLRAGLGVGLSQQPVLKADQSSSWRSRQVSQKRALRCSTMASLPFDTAQSWCTHSNVHIGESAAASAGWTTLEVMTPVQLQTMRLLLVSPRPFSS